MPSSFESRMQAALDERREKGSLRRLPADPVLHQNPPTESAPDFSSNDYLGFAHKGYRSSNDKKHDPTARLSCSGSTGSRLLAGDSPQFHCLERRLADWHGVPYSLLCNSGYDANLSVVSCLAADVILYDGYIHNSLHMGLRLWKSAAATTTSTTKRTSHSFRHNSVKDLERLLRNHHQNGSVVAILIESVYSMDGDIAPVRAMLDLAATYGAHVVVDEAHGWGVLGASKGFGALEDDGMHHPALAFAIYTYGKAAGAHGALICCPSRTARDYLVNYAYPFIYSTALPEHSLRCIEKAYETLDSPYGWRMRRHVQELIAQFRSELEPFLNGLSSGSSSRRHQNEPSSTKRLIRLLPSTTPIQALLVPGNAACTQLCEDVFRHGATRLFPIKSPTVPVGMERVRIVLHGHNTRMEVTNLVQSMKTALLRQQGNAMRPHAEHRSKL